MTTIPRYTIDRGRPARDYETYLATYGNVYGDMSDPGKRADTVKALRRRDALTLAGARRRHRAEIAELDTDSLRYDARVKRYQIECCAHVRPWNIRNADIGTFRMIINELRKRGEL